MLISTRSAQIVLQFDSKQHENNGFKCKLCGVISVIISLSSVLFHTTCEIWLRAVWRANPNRLFTCVDQNPQSWLFYAVSKEGTDNTSEDRQNNHLISSDLTTRMSMQIISAWKNGSVYKRVTVSKTLDFPTFSTHHARICIALFSPRDDAPS